MKHGLAGCLTIDCFLRSRVNLGLPVDACCAGPVQQCGPVARGSGVPGVLEYGDGAYLGATPWYGSGHLPTGSNIPNLGKTGETRKISDFSIFPEKSRNS